MAKQTDKEPSKDEISGLWVKACSRCRGSFYGGKDHDVCRVCQINPGVNEKKDKFEWPRQSMNRNTNESANKVGTEWLDELERLEKEAEQAPWIALDTKEEMYHGGYFKRIEVDTKYAALGVAGRVIPEDAEFICFLRNNCDRLISMARKGERYEKALKEIKEYNDLEVDWSDSAEHFHRIATEALDE